MKEIAVKYCCSVKNQNGSFTMTKESHSLEFIREFVKELEQNNPKLIVTIFKRVTSEEIIEL